MGELKIMKLQGIFFFFSLLIFKASLVHVQLHQAKIDLILVGEVAVLAGAEGFRRKKN